MALVTFEPTDVDLDLSFKDQPALLYRVRVKDERFDYVELSIGEKFSQMNGSINIFLDFR